MVNSTLVSLAILKTNFDQGKDIYRTLSPLVLDAIKETGLDIISVPSIKEEISRIFGLNIPFHVIDTILLRLRNENYIKIDKINSNVKTLIKLKNCEKLTTVSDEIINQLESLIDDIVNYVKGPLNSQISDCEAEEALLSFLDYYQVEIFCQNGAEKIVPVEVKETDKNNFIIASYLQYLVSNNSPKIKYLENIAKGYMLSNALYLPSPHSPKNSFQNTKLLFDTTFLIYALGYAGEPRKEPCIELLKLLYELGANLFCFQHTIEEMGNALENVSILIDQNRYDDIPLAAKPTVEHFISINAKGSDIKFFKTRLKDNLISLNITIIESPDYRDHYLQIDEESLRDNLSKNIPYGPHSENAIYRDVKSISSIFRLREGKICENVETSKALFITSNFKLAKTVRNHFHSKGLSKGFPLCITDNVLTNLIWLKSPIKSPNLPLKRIIADSYAMINPSQELWKKYVSEIEKLKDQGEITEEHFFLLRYELSAQSVLMEKTLGQEGAFTQGTIPEILKAIEDSIHKKLRKELKDVIREKDILSKEEVLRLDILKKRAKKITSVIISTIKIVIILVLSFCAYLDFKGSDKKYIGITALVLLTYFIYDLIKNIFFGLKFRELENKIINKLYELMLSLAGYEKKP